MNKREVNHNKEEGKLWKQDTVKIMERETCKTATRRDGNEGRKLIEEESDRKFEKELYGNMTEK